VLLYLSGGITQTLLANPRPDVGLMLSPGMGTFDSRRLEVAMRWWAADNGRFAAPELWNAGDWLEWAASMRRWRETCLFLVAPDVVGDAPATLDLSLPYLPTIRQLGFKAAFVSQDGATDKLVPWQEFDCLFVGGSTEWKLSEASYALINKAKWLGKWTHMGRVNSLRRLRACLVSAFDSADGTYVRFGPDRRLPQLYDWLDEVNGPQRVLVAV
jgi:hypothetical protein